MYKLERLHGLLHKMSWRIILQELVGLVRQYKSSNLSLDVGDNPKSVKKIENL